MARFIVLIISFIIIEFTAKANNFILPYSFLKTSFDSSKNNLGEDIIISNAKNEKLLKNFVKSGDSIRISSLNKKEIFIYKFSKSFSPAAPPMLSKSLDANPNLLVDSTYQISNGELIVFNEPGLYFAQTDTVSNIGLGFRVVNKDYPKFKKVPHLTQTMIYISTNNEIQAVIEAKKKKHVFNSFWLNMGGDINNSQRLIKEYFDRVTYANEHFTSFKEGWKTDKGMIYIVFGKPNNILQKNGQETWVYIGKKKQIAFNFSPKKNIFSNKHFKLNRHAGLQRSWFKQVEKWRTGRID